MNPHVETPLTHGTRSHLARGEPVFSRLVGSKESTLQLIREGPEIEVGFVAERDSVGIPLGLQRCEVSLDSGPTQKVTTRRGEVNFYPAGTRIHARTEERIGELLVLYVAPSYRLELLEDYSGGGLDEARNSIGVPELGTLVRDIRARLASGQNIEANETDEIALEILSGLFRAATGYSPEPPSRLGTCQVSRVIEYIEANLNRPLGTAELADLCGTSRHHFCRSFKAVTGVSPHQFVLDRRVSRARRQLASSRAPLAGIAYSCGFSSQSHMSDTFSRVLGVSPGRYRDNGPT